MGYGWGFGKCAPKCTHRKLTDDPEILWSESVSTCAAPIVLDSCIDSSGNTFIVGRWQDGSNFGFARQIDPADGSAIWTQHYRGTIHCCTTDGTSLWIAGESLPNSLGLSTDNLFKLDPSDGETIWSVTSWHQVIYDCIHDGAGKVYVCGSVNPYQSVEFNWSDPGGDYGNYLNSCGYASLYDGSGEREVSFGGGGNSTHWEALTQDQALSIGFVSPAALINPAIPSLGVSAYSIDLDEEGNIYVGSDVWVSGCSSVGTCGNAGSVAKFNSDHELQWLFGNRICGAVRFYDGDLYCGFCSTIVNGLGYAKAEFVPFTQLQRWTTDEVTRVWGRTLQVFGADVSPGDIRPIGVTDIEVSDTGVYATHQWWVSKLDHSGNYEWSSRHAKPDVGGQERGVTYYTVELDPSEETETLYVGGRGANCAVDDQDDSTTPATGDCEPSWLCEQRPNTRGPHGGIYSWICPGKEIECSVPDTFYGSGCFGELDPINYTWIWVDGCSQFIGPVSPFEPCGYWRATFEIPCGEGTLSVILTARQISDNQCDGWEVLYNVSGGEGCSNSGAATVSQCGNCDLPEGEYVFDLMPFAWSATFLTSGCVCCDEGGGGNEPPGGVDCGDCTIPETLFVEFTITSNTCGVDCIESVSGVFQYNGTGFWTLITPELPCGSRTELYMNCDLVFQVTCNDIENGIVDSGAFVNLTMDSCDPLMLSGSGAFDPFRNPPAVCCIGGSLSFTVSITE
jgi:hypothetical protein